MDTKYGQLDLPRKLHKPNIPQLDLPIYPNGKPAVLEGFSMVPPNTEPSADRQEVPLAVPSGGCEPHHIRLGLEAKRLGAGAA